MSNADSIISRKNIFKHCKKPSGFKNTWNGYCRNTPLVDLIVNEVLEELPSVDEKASKELLDFLNGISSRDRLCKPDAIFGDAGARSGYIRKRMRIRYAYMGCALLKPECKEVLLSLLSQPRLRMASIGGASGADALGYFLLSNAFGYGGAEHPNILDTTVFEFERGWKESTEALQRVIVRRGKKDSELSSIELQEKLGSSKLSAYRCDAIIEGTKNSWGKIDFASCDVTAPIEPEGMNAELYNKISTFDFFVFSYVLIENCRKIEASQFAFVRQVLKQSKIGAILMFMDSGYQMFRDIVEVAVEVLNEYNDEVFESPETEKWEIVRVTPKFKNTLILWKRQKGKYSNISEGNVPPWAIGMENDLGKGWEKENDK
eukprot:g2745.t1